MNWKVKAIGALMALGLLLRWGAGRAEIGGGAELPGLAAMIRAADHVVIWVILGLALYLPLRFAWAVLSGAGERRRNRESGA